MSGEKFTKGEWSTDGMGIVESGTRIVCDTYMTCKEDLANSHLIAAAPEMYEMLNRWVNSVECVADNYQEGLKEETMDLIAKARGES